LHDRLTFFEQRNLALNLTLDGAFDAADTTLTATAAEACSALVVFIHTGSDATARLLAYIDTPTSGLPFTPAAGQAVPIEAIAITGDS
jgi:hypothetical protein